MLAENIMEPVKGYLTPDMTLKEAVAIMRRTTRGHGLPVKGMVVMDSEKKLVGVLSIKDLLRILIPSYMVENSLEGFTWEGMLKERAEKARTMTVGEVMTSKVVTVPPTASLMFMADLMIEKKMQRLPVVAENGEVLGIVYIRDIFNTLYNFLHEE